MFVCFSDVLNPYAKEIWQMALAKMKTISKIVDSFESRFLSFFSHNYKIAYGSI